MHVPWLTKKEERLCRWVADGLANKEIAAKLNLSVQAVKYQLRLIYDKARLTRRISWITRTELAVWYISRRKRRERRRRQSSCRRH